MPRRFLPLANQEYYHVFNRGVNKRSLFKNQFDYHRILAISHFYSFSPTPFRFSRLLDLTPKEQNRYWKKLRQQPKLVNYFNTKYTRIGPLWQGQFKAVMVESDNQLLHLSRYIHLNPYTSSVVKNPTDLKNYPWSSLSEYISKVNKPLCHKSTIMSYFKKESNYLDFVLDLAEYQKELALLKHLAVD